MSLEGTSTLPRASSRLAWSVHPTDLPPLITSSDERECHLGASATFLDFRGAVWCVDEPSSPSAGRLPHSALEAPLARPSFPPLPLSRASRPKPWALTFLTFHLEREG
jgi:hypothetical protein